MPDLPVIVVFSKTPVLRLQTRPHSIWESFDLDCRWFPNDARLEEVLERERPQAIVSIGRRAEYSRLASSSPETQRKWLHVENGTPLPLVGEMAFERFLQSALSGNEIQADAPLQTLSEKPLVSVFTPTFRTGETRLRRALDSLLAQEYSSWEWVVVDDSDDGGETFQQLEELAAREPRLKISAMPRRSGRIGEVKRRACDLSEGEILVELDHDDELTPNALGDVASAFAQFPEAGFVYSDWAEIREDNGESIRYAENWAFGYGDYREQEYSGRKLSVAQAPPINGETVRHIVGIPNHLRAWRRAEYFACGGHNADLHVADDYELLIRTFLSTRMARIPRLCYLQYQSGGRNTTDVRRGEIQRLVRAIGQFYDAKIHARLLELGLEDPAWNETSGGASFPFIGIPGPRQTEHCTLIAEI